MTKRSVAILVANIINHDPAAFYDCITFFNPEKALAISDLINGKFGLIEAVDSGRSWARWWIRLGCRMA